VPRITARDGAQFEIDVLPDECPLCHYAIEPRPLTAVNTGPVTGAPFEVHLDVAFKCVRRECGHIFVGRYLRAMESIPYGFYIALPITTKPPALTGEIKKLSPAFAEIYEQAAAAESYQLNQIAGVGYRKALEFLIKDYCILKHPSEAEKIKSIFLGTCIKSYVDDANLKDCAELATWLGNDETHYLRRWEDKDIKDLKALLRLTMAWIQTNLLTEKYRMEMKKQ